MGSFTIAFITPSRTGFLSKSQKKLEQAVSLRKKLNPWMRVPIRSHGRGPLHRGSASHKPDGVQAARGRLFYSEAEKSECGTVPMHRTGTAAANAEGSLSTRMESSSSPISSHPADSKQATGRYQPLNEQATGQREVTWKRFFCPEHRVFLHYLVISYCCSIQQQF